MSLRAEQLIRSVTDKYATFLSYKDSGLAFSRDFLVEFETFFVRLDLQIFPVYKMQSRWLVHRRYWRRVCSPVFCYQIWCIQVLIFY